MRNFDSHPITCHLSIAQFLMSEARKSIAYRLELVPLIILSNSIFIEEVPLTKNPFLEATLGRVSKPRSKQNFQLKQKKTLHNSHKTHTLH